MLNFQSIPTEIEAAARWMAEQLPQREEEKPELSDHQTVNATQDSGGRSIGTEHAVLEVLKLLDLANKIGELGSNKRQQSGALTNISDRMAQPGSERATNK
ncbi:MAG: hypothetical protein OXC63_14930 [Aestuariivita sp.]|nr:hypothetical protein [Aestuariivita sp.]MCY4346702.1 hypothetical protein [Aestuariivita sp.]